MDCVGCFKCRLWGKVQVRNIHWLIVDFGCDDCIVDLCDIQIFLNATHIK